MLPAVGAAALMAGGQVLSQGINAMMTGSTNKQSRRYNTYMYDRQRADALADYTMQNEYNSPMSQMNRLREAGLNPNLVYGNGADAQGGTVRSSNAGQWNPKPPQFDIGGAVGDTLGAYYDTQVKQAQIDNLKVQNSVLVQDAALKAAQVRDVTAGAGTKEFDLQFKSEVRDISIEALKLANERTGAEIRKTGVDTIASMDENDRRNIMLAPNLQIAAETALNIQADRLKKEMETAKTQQEIRNVKMQYHEIIAKIENIRADTTIKDKEAAMYKNGNRPGDWIWWRELNNILSGEYNDNVLKNLRDLKGGIQTRPERR